MLKETTKLVGPFETMPQEPWYPRKGAKPDHVIKLNCRDVHTYASYKTTTAWENFNNQRTEIPALIPTMINS